MCFAFGDLFAEEEFGPGAVQDGLVSVLEEALMEEVGPAPAAVNPVLVFLPLRSVTGAMPLYC
jgi:hypothetical protein